MVLNSVHAKNQNDFEEAALRTAASGLKDPEKTQRSIDKEASQLSAARNLSVTKRNIAKAKVLAQEAQQDVDVYQNLRARIENEVQTVKSRQIKTLIADLKNPASDIRASAARKLSQSGDAITKGDFNTIVDIMHHGKDVSRKKLYRESHCTWYEDTQSRYYAAEALLEMKSSYVSNQIVADARQAKAQGRSKKKVMDAGWV